jgi:MFS family permease
VSPILKAQNGWSSNRNITII